MILLKSQPRRNQEESEMKEQNQQQNDLGKTEKSFASLTNQLQTPQTRILPTTAPGRFVRTPEKVIRDLTRDEEPALYLVHSVRSRRHSPHGDTFEQIMADHEGQARTDGAAPFQRFMAVHWLDVAIRVGLVEKLP